MHQPPPRRLLLAYRALALRLPEQYRAWAAADTASTSFLTWRIVRTTVSGLALAGLYAVGQNAFHRWPGQQTLIRVVLLVVAFGLLSSRKTLARKALQWQHVDKRGNPVRPRRFALLTNAEAALAAAAAVVLFTAGSAVFGYGLRPPPPTGVAVIPCAPPDASTTSQITGKFTDKATTIEHARAVPYSRGLVVGLIIKPSDGKQAFAGFVTQDGTMYEIQAKEAPRYTSYPAPPSLDRVTLEAFRRVATCLGEALKPS